MLASLTTWCVAPESSHRLLDLPLRLAMVEALRVIMIAGLSMIAGNGGAARLRSALDALADHPGRVLSDKGASRSRGRRILARLRRVADGHRLGDEGGDEEEVYKYMSYKPHSVQRQQRKIITHISSNTTTAQTQNANFFKT